MTRLSWHVIYATIIQKSEDGRSFKTIATIKSKSRDGETSTQYNYTDRQLTNNNAIIYYRLKLVDADSRFEYSDNRIITIKESANTSAIKTYPNPFTASLTISHTTLPQHQPGKIEVFNSNGQLILSKATGIGSSTSIETTKLEKGII